MAAADNIKSIDHSGQGSSGFLTIAVAEQMVLTT
jgi:hypothetical protein